MNQKNIDYRKSEKNNNTTIPRTIRYHPNTLKSCFLIYPIRNLIARIETTKETKVPTIKIIASVPVKFRPNFTSFNKLAPNMVGIAGFTELCSYISLYLSPYVFSIHLFILCFLTLKFSIVRPRAAAISASVACS